MPTPSDLDIGKCPPRRSLPPTGGKQSPGLLPRLHFACLILCMICTACGAVGSGPTAPPPAIVSVTPNSAKPFPGGQQQFQAMVQNASSNVVEWLVNGTQGGNAVLGTIDSAGLYTAPSVVPSQPTVTVTAVLQSDATKTGSASVTIQSFSAYMGPLVVSPALSSVTTSQTLQLQILTPGIGNSNVSWAANGGTISAGGLFTPPRTPGAYTIVASLPNTNGTATVEVTGYAGTLTWRNDNMRSGVNNQELALATGTVNSSKFGKLFSCPIDGYAYAQPLYVPNLTIPGSGTRNVIFVATEKDFVFAFDADAKPCVQLWKTSLIPAGSEAIATPNFDITSTDLVPFVGITGTPVIAASSSLLYVVAATQKVEVNPVYDHRLYALDLATGQPEILPGGADIAPLPGQGIPFAPALQNQRAALLLENGTIYIAYGSYGGLGDAYHGWLFAYDASSMQQTGAFNVTPGSFFGGIWQSGGGPSADSNHNVFVVTGNGTFDLGRQLSTYSYSNSFLKFATAGGLSLADYFSPCNEATLGAAGLGVGSGAPLLLPDSAGSASQPHLLMGGSMGGSLYVLNRDNMGQFAGSCPDSLSRVQTIPVGNGPILSSPLYWNGAVYVAPGNANLQSFALSNGLLASSPSAAQSPEMLGPQGATPVISSNGTTNAILWLIDSSGALATPKNTAAILRAYDPNNLSNEIYSSAMAAASRDMAGLAVKFSIPTVANGKVYVGTQAELDVYGLLP